LLRQQEDESEGAKETTPLVGGAGSQPNDTSVRDDDKKIRKDKKGKKGKKSKIGDTDANTNESHGSRRWRLEMPRRSLRDDVANVRRQRLGGTSELSSDMSSYDSDS
jgi:hypothetical protein